VILTVVGWFNFGISILATVLWAKSSLAATVVLVHPANPAPGMAEALARINGELVSAGFSIEVLDGSVAEAANGDSRSWLEHLAARRGADAVVAVMGDQAPDSVEVWVIDKVTGKSVVRRVPFRPLSPTGPATLAIQAVELLRASFLEIDISSSARHRGSGSTPPPTVIHFLDLQRTAEQPRRFGVEVGGATSMSLGGSGPMIMPVVRIDWTSHPWFVVQATMAGMGSRPTVDTSAGSAKVAQAFALLGAGYRFRSGKQLMPFVSLSAGALHTTVDGQADWPLQGRHVDCWSLLLGGEFGASVALQERFYLSLSALAQVAEPYPAVRFAGAVVATYTRPNMLLALTIGAWL
jgi:hypothetical protein